MDYKEILYEVDNRVATITLNRPETLNAFTDGMLDEWTDALERAQQDDHVWVVVVTGAGRGFCSGGNVKDFAYAADREAPPLHAQRHHMRDGVHRVPRAVARLEKPYIAAVNGPAAGVGMDMASMADIRIASARATFVMSYYRRAPCPKKCGARRPRPVWQPAKQRGAVGPAECARDTVVLEQPCFAEKMPLARLRPLMHHLGGHSAAMMFLGQEPPQAL